jgi:hypothetical protein
MKANKGDTDIPLAIRNLGTITGWMANATLYPRKDSVPTAQEVGWALGPVWTGI